MDEPLIVKVIRHYYPDWEAPADSGKTWLRTLCPFHAESRPSAAVSYELGAFNCLGCGVKGTAVTIIKHREGVTHAEAIRLSKEISPHGDGAVSPEPSRQRRRVLFADERAVPDEREGRKVPPRVRRRAFGRP